MAKMSVLLRKHPPESQAYIQRSCKLIKVAAGDTVYTQGAASDAFYMIESGRFVAEQTASDGTSSQLVRELRPNDTFGSHELLASSEPRVESVKCGADLPGSVWMLPKKIFDAKLKDAPAPGPKLLDKIRHVPLFAGLRTEQLSLLCRAVVDVKAEKHNMVCTQGDQASHVYALIDGQLKRVVDGDEDAKGVAGDPEHKPCDEAVNREREEEHKRAGQRGEPRGCRLQRGCCQRGGRVDIRGDGVRAVLAIVLTAAA